MSTDKAETNKNLSEDKAQMVEKNDNDVVEIGAGPAPAAATSTSSIGGTTMASLNEGASEKSANPEQQPEVKQKDIPKTGNTVKASDLKIPPAQDPTKTEANNQEAIKPKNPNPIVNTPKTSQVPKTKFKFQPAFPKTGGAAKATGLPKSTELAKPVDVQQVAPIQNQQPTTSRAKRQLIKSTKYSDAEYAHTKITNPPAHKKSKKNKN